MNLSDDIVYSSDITYNIPTIGTIMHSVNSIDAIIATHMANYEDTTIYRLNTFDDLKISFDLKIPAGTMTGMYLKDSIGFIKVNKNNNESENIIRTIDMIRTSIYNKLKHYIPINPPNTHNQYKLRIYHINRMINIIKYNNQTHQISFDRLRTIMRYCSCDVNILVNTLLVGKNDFTLYMYITGLTINSIPLIPETTGLHIILNKEKIERMNKYKSSNNAPIKKKYFSKKEIKGDILKIFNLAPV